MDILTWLNNWYISNCDGDWEHQYGVHVDTLDNPGWWLKVDILDTPHEGKMLKVKVLNTSTDWYTINCDGEKFEAWGDPTKLPTLITMFKHLVEADEA
jgi:hypothetical protein